MRHFIYRGPVRLQIQYVGRLHKNTRTNEKRRRLCRPPRAHAHAFIHPSVLPDSCDGVAFTRCDLRDGFRFRFFILIKYNDLGASSTGGGRVHPIDPWTRPNIPPGNREESLRRHLWLRRGHKPLLTLPWANTDVFETHLPMLRAFLKRRSASVMVVASSSARRT